MAPLFGPDPPRKTGSLDSDLFFALLSTPHCVFCFLIGHRNNGWICPSVGTFDHQRLFSQNSLQQIAPWWTFSNKPLLKESILERSIQRHAVSGIGCGASDPNIILLWFFASRPIVAGGRGNLVSPIYNQESFVACPDTYSWSSQCLLDALSYAHCSGIKPHS